MNYVEEILQAITIIIVLLVANFLLNTSRALKAIELCKESLVLLNGKALRIDNVFGQIMYKMFYAIMFFAYHRVSDQTRAIACGKKLLAILRECGDTFEESTLNRVLAQIYNSQSMYAEAKEHYERAILAIRKTGHRRQEASAYTGLGNVCRSLSEYTKAKEYQKKALAIYMEIGDRAGEAACYGNLGSVFHTLGEYVRDKEYQKKALAICMEIGDRAGEAVCYGHLGVVFGSLGEYIKAKEYLEKALAIHMEIGDRAGESTCYGNLGDLFRSLGEYSKAKEYQEKALAMFREIGNREREAASYADLGAVFDFVGEYAKSKEYQEKALAIQMEIGDREGEAASYGNLGTLFCCLSEYTKGKEYLEKALAICMEIGNRLQEASCYECLADVFERLGEDATANEYREKALLITTRMKDNSKKYEAEVWMKLGQILLSRKKYGGAVKYFEKALAMNVTIGDRLGEKKCYERLGTVFETIGNMLKAKEYYEKTLAIATEIGHRRSEGVGYLCLGNVSLHECFMAEKYFKKALYISKDIGDAEFEFQCYCYLTVTKLKQKKSEAAFSYLVQSVRKFEEIRALVGDSDQFKISFADKNDFPYQLLSMLLCDAGNPSKAIYAADLGRARALADLITTQYSVKTHISADQQSWIGIENVMKKESNCSCLYISYWTERIFLWILKKSGVVSLSHIRVDKKTLHTRLGEVARNLDEFFAIMAKSFRSFGILPEELCEDRSLNDIESELKSLQENLTTLRQGKNTNDPEPSLTLFYDLLVKPVIDLLDEPEIIIVPDRGLYRVPFPALLDGRGKYLSERFRIRVVPSLMTLKLIQESPADYHSHTGALVVGDPDVGVVIYRGRVNKKFVPLPGARKEAEMIARRLGVQPLLGRDATKKSVVEKLNSVSLIHIAAHGNAERGEIALSPPRSITGIPQEDDYLLKMSDVSKVQVRAKLAVLSCCHSGRGQIRAEGVVGVARAFLGSGARSVLVALWALEDRATEQLMNCFYEHLVRGESASESLHAAMKWMRDHGFIEVHQWAPFMLIGDNVTFAFGK